MLRKNISLVKEKRMCYHVPMELSLVDKSVLKIKGKHTSIIVDPFEKMTKTPADAVLLVDVVNSNPSKVTEQRIVIRDPGEYEVGGVKITGLRSEKQMVYTLNVDGVLVLVSDIGSLSFLKEGMEAAQVVVLKAEKETDSSFATAVEANVLILYGEKSEAAIKILGKEPLETSKFSITSDKITEEMQLVWLK